MTNVTFVKASYSVVMNGGSQAVKEGYTFKFEGFDFGVCKESNGWVVTELKSGAVVHNKAMSSRKAIVELVTAKVTDITPQKFQEGIDSILKHQEELSKAKEDQARDKAEQDEKAKRVAENIEAKRKAKEQAEKEAAAKKQAEQEQAKKSEQEKASDPEPKVEEKPKKVWNIGQFFKNIASLEELKKAYRKFSKWLHPDVSDYENASEAFKAMHNQYEQAEKLIKSGKKVEAEEINVEISEFLKNAISIIKDIEGAEIKVRGTWVWVAGIDRKDINAHTILKSAGFKFGAKACEWYLADETAGQKKRRGRGYSAEDLTEKWGEIKVKDINRKAKSKEKLTSKVAESKKGYKKGK